jgi:tritrans,polycis-undecaprenyl-diphosphate synthase [geranylgeranyl-diphosphate specific]
MHIGIILDGNRRFAKKIGQSTWKGHEEGAKRVEELLDWCKELNVKELTLYCFSIENFNRPNEEVNFLMTLFRKFFKKFENDKRIDETKVKIRFIGEKNLLDKEIQEIIKRLEEKTEKYNNFIINFALAYGGRQEILSAVKRLIEEKKEINEKNFQDSLWTSDEPDLIIRTGGEKRTSNFLPWQSVYSEWLFLDKMWPEFTKQDLKEAIDEFEKRERRFGK